LRQLPALIQEVTESSSDGRGVTAGSESCDGVRSESFRFDGFGFNIGVGSP